MEGWVPTIYRLDRWDAMLGALSYVSAFEHTDGIDGSDTSECATLGEVEKGDRLLWRDEYGTWHEHVVVQVVEERSSGRVLRVYGENSLCETLNDYVEDRRVVDGTASTALARTLESTRWEVGQVDDFGLGTWNAYQVSAREAISDICDTWGCEVETDIRASGQGVSRRIVNLVRRGGDTGKRFTYRKDLVGCVRTVMENEVKTAMYGYGKGEESVSEDGTPTGGYGRKLTFGDINGGFDYVADEEALQRWGRPDGKGGKAHAFGSVTFQDCTDKEELLELTKQALKEACEPQVSYEVNAVNLAAAGIDYEHEGCQVGDTVRIVDTSYEPELRLVGRVIKKTVRYGLSSQATVTLGNVVPANYTTLGDLAAQMDAMREQAGKWDWAASADSSYVSAVIAGLNELFDSVGGYVYVSPADGITIYDRAQDDNPTMAMQLSSAGFRIANSKLSDGTWDWRTFGTGDGFTADELVVGVIKGGSSYWDLATGDVLFERGTIQSLDGENSWNLTTGDMDLGGDLTIHGGQISDADGDNVWNLDTGDMTLGGSLTINGGRIQSTDGQCWWDLGTGDMMLRQGTIQSADGLNKWELGSGNLTLGGSLTISNGRIQSADGSSYWDLATGDMALSWTPAGMATEDDIEVAVGNAKDDLENQISSVQSDADQAQSTANSALNAAQDALDEAEDNAYDINLVKNKTDRISFTSNGMQIEGTNGEVSSVATYTSQGFYINSQIAEINTPSAQLQVKNWGMNFQSDADVSFYVTDGTGDLGGSAIMRAAGPGFDFRVSADGITFNGEKIH